PQLASVHYPSLTGLSSLPLPDALPISAAAVAATAAVMVQPAATSGSAREPPAARRDPPSTETIAARPATGATTSDPHRPRAASTDRKSTRLNSSHGSISYAVFCLKKKK